MHIPKKPRTTKPHSERGPSIAQRARRPRANAENTFPKWCRAIGGRRHATAAASRAIIMYAQNARRTEKRASRARNDAMRIRVHNAHTHTLNTHRRNWETQHTRSIQKKIVCAENVRRARGGLLSAYVCACVCMHVRMAYVRACCVCACVFVPKPK